MIQKQVLPPLRGKSYGMKNKNLVKYLNNLIDTDTHKDIMNGTRRIGLSMDQKQTVYDTNPNAPAPTGWENFAYEILV